MFFVVCLSLFVFDWLQVLMSCVSDDIETLHVFVVGVSVNVFSGLHLILLCFYGLVLDCLWWLLCALC